VNINAGGEIKKKYQNRRDISYRQALHYYELMQGNAREICLKCFGYELKGQAVYNGVKTTPSLLIVGTNGSFLAANAYTLGYGRNLNDETRPQMREGPPNRSLPGERQLWGVVVYRYFKRYTSWLQFQPRFVYF